MAADIEAVRDWTGSEPDDDTIHITWDRYATATMPVERTALAILRRRRADLAAAPTSWAVEGDYREARNKAADLKALDALIGRLETLTGDQAGNGPVNLTSAPICAPGGYR